MSAHCRLKSATRPASRAVRRTAGACAPPNDTTRPLADRVVDLLWRSCHPQSGCCLSDKLASLRRLGDLLLGVASGQEESALPFSAQQLALCLRAPLLQSSADRRLCAAAFRALRCLVRWPGAAHLLTSPPLLLHLFIVRALDSAAAVGKDEERVQALLLARALLHQSPTRFPRAIARSLVALVSADFHPGSEASVAATGAAAPGCCPSVDSGDQLWLLSVATVCQLAVQAPDRLLACRGHQCLAQAALRCSQPRLVETIVTVLLRLSEYRPRSGPVGPSGRDCMPQLGELMLPLMDSTLNETVASPVCLSSACRALLLLLHSWCGLLTVGCWHRHTLADMLCRLACWPSPPPPSLSSAPATSRGGDGDAALTVCQHVLTLLYQLLCCSCDRQLDFSLPSYQLVDSMCRSFPVSAAASVDLSSGEHSASGLIEHAARLLSPLGSRHRRACAVTVFRALQLQLLLDCGLLESLSQLAVRGLVLAAVPPPPAAAGGGQAGKWPAVVTVAAVLIGRALWLTERLLPALSARYWHALPQLVATAAATATQLPGPGGAQHLEARAASQLADQLAAVQLQLASRCREVLPADSVGAVFCRQLLQHLHSASTSTFACTTALPVQVSEATATSSSSGNATSSSGLARWQEEAVALAAGSRVEQCGDGRDWHWPCLAALVTLLLRRRAAAHGSPLAPVCRVLRRLCQFASPGSGQFASQSVTRAAHGPAGELDSASGVHRQALVLADLLQYLSHVDVSVCQSCCRLVGQMISDLTAVVRAAVHRLSLSCSVSSTSSVSPSRSSATSSSGCSRASAALSAVQEEKEPSSECVPAWATEAASVRALASSTSCYCFLFIGRLLAGQPAPTAAAQQLQLQLFKLVDTVARAGCDSGELPQLLVVSLDYTCRCAAEHDRNKYTQREIDTDKSETVVKRYQLEDVERESKQCEEESLDCRQQKPPVAGCGHCCWCWSLLARCAESGSSTLRSVAVRQMSLLSQCPAAQPGLACHAVALTLQLMCSLVSELEQSSSSSNHPSVPPSPTVTLLSAVLGLLHALCEIRPCLRRLAASDTFTRLLDRLMAAPSAAAADLRDECVLLLARLAGCSAGFRRLVDEDRLAVELCRWREGGFAARYTQLMERRYWRLSDTAAACAAAAGDECWSEQLGETAAGGQLVLPHLLGELASHEQGATWLSCHSRWPQQCAALVREAAGGGGAPADSGALRSALWCVGNVARAGRGSAWLWQQTGAIAHCHSISLAAALAALAASSDQLLLRATSCLVLSMCAATAEGRSALTRVGWQSTVAADVPCPDHCAADDRSCSFDDEHAAGVATAPAAAAVASGHRRSVSEQLACSLDRCSLSAVCSRVDSVGEGRRSVRSHLSSAVSPVSGALSSSLARFDRLFRCTADRSRHTHTGCLSQGDGGGERRRRRTRRLSATVGRTWTNICRRPSLTTSDRPHTTLSIHQLLSDHLSHCSQSVLRTDDSCHDTLHEVESLLNATVVARPDRPSFCSHQRHSLSTVAESRDAQCHCPCFSLAVPINLSRSLLSPALVDSGGAAAAAAAHLSDSGCAQVSSGGGAAAGDTQDHSTASCLLCCLVSDTASPPGRQSHSAQSQSGRENGFAPLAEHPVAECSQPCEPHSDVEADTHCQHDSLSCGSSGQDLAVKNTDSESRCSPGRSPDCGRASSPAAPVAAGAGDRWAVRREVMRLASLVNSGVAAPTAERCLRRLFHCHSRWLPSDLCLYSQLVQDCLSVASFSSQSRRFLHQLFHVHDCPPLTEHALSVLASCCRQKPPDL